MPDDRDGQHAGGSIVDTTRANTSPEEIKKDSQGRQQKQKTGKEPDAGQQQKEDQP
jgi:hypothetical protein